ncbi:MAG: DNA topoisomerase IV subunit B [Bacteroidales bacterium]|jgi:topoisomerase-4 subunit B|nr:type IIA DNA topoisomerase subunit B [Bacteroidales bacterium]MEE1098215.1 DNA topoisomerase IV subunit B [Bacteroidales bacterium]
MTNEELLNKGEYTEDNIKSLEWSEHIRLRPGMYIGKLGDGASADDGVYVLIKEIIDNSIDEFAMGCGKLIEVDIDFESKHVRVRDYGRGIPLKKVVDCVSKMNTGAKYDSEAFQKSVGMNGVGTKAVNALSSYFKVESVRDGMKKVAEFRKGVIFNDAAEESTEEQNGTCIEFVPDNDSRIFGKYAFIDDYITKMIWHYVCLNKGLSIIYNGKKYYSKNGLLDLLVSNMNEADSIYPIIHLSDDNFEFAFTHSDKVYTEEHYSFVNGQNTTQGGTHLAGFREALVKVLKDFYKKDYEPSDVRQGLVAAISLRIEEPVFESQTKTKLGSNNMKPDGSGVAVKTFIGDIVRRTLDDYLHIHSETAELMLQKIVRNEKERKGMQNIRKLAKESAKKVSLTNRKLRDCRVHYNSKDPRRLESTLFITEGDSASGSITKSRDVNTQAVFSLRGKPENSYGKTKEFVYRNEELNLLHNALNIDEDMDNLRYNNVVIATDADVDGMHIRMLLMTFFLKFFPDLVKAGHVYILQTPLFRVRNKRETLYCYTEKERDEAAEKLKGNVEITRFKGLGEISSDEFRHFIGKDIRLDPIILNKESSVGEVLSFFMGSNSPERQEYIIQNLRYEDID